RTTSASAARGPGGGPWRRKWARRRLNSGSTATRRPASSIVALACPHQVMAMVIAMDPVYVESVYLRPVDLRRVHLSPVYLSPVYLRPVYREPGRSNPVATNPGYSSHAGPASPGARSSPRVRASRPGRRAAGPIPGGG